MHPPSLVRHLRSLLQGRFDGSLGDAVGAASVSREDVLDPFDRNVLSQEGAKERQLAAA